MDKGLRYHRVFCEGIFTCLIIEVNCQFYWLSIFVEKKHRDRFLSQKIVEAIINQVLIGKHEIHMFPSIRSIKKLAKEMRWTLIGKSDLFELCIKYRTRSKKMALAKLPFSIKTKTTKRYPVNVKNILDKEICNQVLDIIL